MRAKTCVERDSLDVRLGFVDHHLANGAVLLDAQVLHDAAVANCVWRDKKHSMEICRKARILFVIVLWQACKHTNAQTLQKKNKARIAFTHSVGGGRAVVVVVVVAFRLCRSGLQTVLMKICIIRNDAVAVAVAADQATTTYGVFVVV